MVIHDLPDFILNWFSWIKYEISYQVSKKRITHEYENFNENNLLEYLPSTILNKLYEFQKNAIKIGLQKNGRVIISDEMVIRFYY